MTNSCHYTRTVGNRSNDHSYPGGQTVWTKAILQIRRYLVFPHGFRNSAALASRHTHRLFADSTPINPIPDQHTFGTHRTRHFVNMVSVQTLSENDTSSMQSSTSSVQTEVSHLEDEDYDMHFPLGFSRFPVPPPRRGNLILNVSNDETVLDGETDDQRQQRATQCRSHLAASTRRRTTKAEKPPKSRQRFRHGGKSTGV